MALLHLNYNSECMAGNTDIRILFPERPFDAELGDFYGGRGKYLVL